MAEGAVVATAVAPAPAVTAAVEATPAHVETAPAVEAPVETAPAVEAPVETAPTEAPAEPAAPTEGPSPSLVAEATTEGDAEAVIPPFQFEPFTLPEGVQLDPASMENFTGILTNPDLTHQARAQSLIDLHLAALNELSGRLAQHQQKAFDDTRAGWRDNFERDPDIGGNRRDTTLRHCAAVRDRFAGDETQRRELLDALNYTGIGDHPAFIRFLSNIGTYLAEGRARAASPPVRGVPTEISGTQPATRIERRYINTQGMNGNAH